MWSKDGRGVDPDTPGATKHVACHGYYTSEADAIKAMHTLAKLANNPKQYPYYMEKVYRRILND